MNIRLTIIDKRTLIAVSIAMLLAFAFAWQSTVAQEVLPAPQSVTPNVNMISQNSVQPQARGFDVSIGDLTTVLGVRTNKLTGIGLVTGLDRTGGSNPSTRQFQLTAMERFGNRATPVIREAIRTNTQVKTSSVSIVVVTAELPAFTKAGTKINVSVSTFDDATSLKGGQLMTTPLYGFDGEVYAVASGQVNTGGISSAGQAATVTVNHPTAGVVPGGATVEKEVCDQQFARDGKIQLLMREKSFINVGRMADAINAVMPNSAVAVDMKTVQLNVPQHFPRRNLAEYQQAVLKFVATAQQARIVPHIPARVIINERTGTVVIGENVRISRVIFSHANLSVVAGESPQVVQPAPLSQGQTAVVPRTSLEVNEGSDAFRLLDEPITVGELARALNALGATPRDLSAILLSMQSAGALHAEIISE